MPIEKRYPLPELFEALRTYQGYKNRRISLEYTLIRGVNDAPALADALADLAHGLICFVNLIPFNPIPARPEWGPSPPAAIERFSAGLTARGVGNAVRRRGDATSRPPAGSCGCPRRAERRGSAPPRSVAAEDLLPVVSHHDGRVQEEVGVEHHGDGVRMDAVRHLPRGAQSARSVQNVG